MTKVARIEKGAPGHEVAVRTQHPEMRTLVPFEEMERLFDRMFEGLWPRGWLPRFHGGLLDWPELRETLDYRVPSVDVIDRDAELVVRAELPGVDKKDLDVSLADQVLTIRGHTLHEEQEEKGEYHRTEIRRGEFSRSMTLPAAVDDTKVKATFNDGVLELILPKIETAQRRTIKVE